jgi:hypothetical protein
VYQLSRTIPVNEPGKVLLSRHEVWAGLMMKAQNALPYVPQMQKCDVIEKGDGWLLRDIMLNNTALREKVSFEPEKRVIFERVGGPELGRIENIIGEDAQGNLTLTFAFGLTKAGVPEGSAAETAHFTPMEGMYLGAVAATLAAVRRTVTDQGRQSMGPASPIDAEGDNRWIFEFFRTADSLDMPRFLAMFADDVRLTLANYPTTVGIEAVRAGIGGLWQRIKGMSHSLTGAWSLHGGEVGIAESQCMYTRPDDTVFTVRPCTVLRRRGEKVVDLRIHVDLNGL